MSTIKILLVDDHQIIIDGLKSVMKNTNDISVVGEANNGREAIRLLSILNVDVVLMDIDMPVMNGIEALKEIKRNLVGVKVIILSMHQESAMIKNLISIGADGYLLKNTNQDELVEAIRKVAGGKPCFSSGVTMSLLNETKNNSKSVDSQTEALTEREIEILKLIAEGFSNKEIGSKLFISHRTVDTHRTNLMKKLNTNNIAGLISFAIKNGFV
jgi:DNA-binding NarL/FixJ family response regulator